MKLPQHTPRRITQEGTRLRRAVRVAGVVMTVAAFAAASANAKYEPPTTTTQTAPSNTALPTVSGIATQGQNLTGTAGTWSGTTPMSYAYQWQRCTSSTSCSSISGATGTSYQVVSADVGTTLRLRITATNSVSSVNAFSTRTATIAASTGGGGGGTTSGTTVVRVDTPWRCTGPVNVDLVKVTMRGAGNAIYIAQGCTGRIGRIEVDTWSEDGVKVHDARDVVIGGGYISCHARLGTVHQDGIQASNGTNITFNNLRIDCPTSPNAGLFISGGSGNPTGVVCDGCMILPSNQSVNIKTSLRSGVRNSTVCRGRSSRAIWIQAGAIDPVNTNNTILAYNDPRCATTAL